MPSKYSRTCPVCGNSFLLKPGHPKTKTCGKTCGIKLRARTQSYTLEQAIDAFWNKVDSAGGPDSCWLWQNSLGRGGYGQCRFLGKSTSSHRVAYELTYGKFPRELDVLHTCDTPACCNPSHLFLGTAKDNSDDMIRKNRAVHPSGKDSPGAKLTPSQVLEIRHRYASEDISSAKLGAQYGISGTQVLNIVKRKQWL